MAYALFQVACNLFPQEVCLKFDDWVKTTFHFAKNESFHNNLTSCTRAASKTSVRLSLKQKIKISEEIFLKLPENNLGEPRPVEYKRVALSVKLAPKFPHSLKGAALLLERSSIFSHFQIETTCCLCSFLSLNLFPIEICKTDYFIMFT